MEENNLHEEKPKGFPKKFKSKFHIPSNYKLTTLKGAPEKPIRYFDSPPYDSNDSKKKKKITFKEFLEIENTEK